MELKNQMKKEDKNSLDRYLEGKYSSLDQQRVIELLGGEEEDDAVRKYVVDDWNSFNGEKSENKISLLHVLDGVHHRIHLKDKKQTKIRKLYHWYSSIAAIILIPLLTLGVRESLKRQRMEALLNEKRTLAQIDSPPGTRLSFELPDGTTGVLNGGASIKYALPFSHYRKVTLKGEAYFHVKHDEKHPFVVDARGMDVKVLGTCFNVNSYDEFSEVVLEEGKVECLLEHGGGQKKIRLQPNERVWVSEGKVHKATVDVSKFIAWKDGRLVLRGASMQEVAQKISQWYNVDVELKGAHMNGYRFRGTFDDDSLEEVLRLLKMTSPLDYRIRKRKELPDGSYSKKHVTISYISENNP